MTSQRSSTALFSEGRAVSVGAALLCASGFCALVYQTVWLRELRVIFGASAISTSAVLALFLGGLGLGAWLLGPRIERSAHPLATYGWLEIATAALAAVSPLVLDVVHRAYLAAGGREGLGAAAVPLQLLLAAVVLVGPTVLMGGTLPAIARAITLSGDAGRRGAALAYGWNTVGAVAGTLATTFFLFEAVGLRVTLWWAAGLNVIVGMVARSLARTAAPLHENGHGLSPRARAEPSVLVAAFLCGLVFLLFELVWYRLLSSLLGGSSYSFNVVLATALAGIGLGGLLYARRTTPPSWTTFAGTLALEALLLLAPLALGDELPFFAHALRAWGQASFGGIVFGWCVLTGVVVLPGALVSGYQFPLLIALAGRGRDGVAVESGSVYAANTLGSIVGSVVTGFVLIPQLGPWRTAGAGALGLATLAAVHLARARRPLVSVCLLVAVGVLAMRPGPGVVWRGTSVGAGRAPLAAATANERRAIVAGLEAAEVEHAHGVESDIAIHASDGLALLVNGKSDGNTIVDAQTTVGAVLIPALLHPAPRRGFVIGLGTGQSAGWLAAVPTVEHVGVVELEQHIVDFAAACADTNQDATRSPKVHVVVGDGREALQTTSDRVDIMMSEPSNPYRAGVAGFYTTDFYAAVRARLNDDGLFAQWIQGYDVDAATIQLAVSTLRSVFPHVTIWRTSSSDLLLVASPRPIVLDRERMADRLRQEPFRSAFGRIYWFTAPEDIATLVVAGERLVDALASAWQGGLNSDDLPILEFAFARGAGKAGASVIAALDALASRLALDTVEVRGTLDWGAVRARRGRHAWPLGAGGAAPVDPANMVAAGAYERARAALLSSPVPTHPADALMELRALVSHVGSAGDDGRVGPRLELVRAHGWETEARLIELQRALTVRADIAPPFSAFVEALRTDPWLASGLTEEASRALIDGAHATPGAAALMQVPFAGARLAHARRDARLALHARDMDPACVEFFVEQGDGLPWARAPLAARAACFTRHAPQRAPEAIDALAAFDEASPTQFTVAESPGQPQAQP